MSGTASRKTQFGDRGGTLFVNRLWQRAVAEEQKAGDQRLVSGRSGFVDLFVRDLVDPLWVAAERREPLLPALAGIIAR